MNVGEHSRMPNEPSRDYVVLRQDKSDLDEVVPVNSRLLRVAYILLGSLFVGIGVVGIFVPGLPTTVFLIMAAALYARSSSRLYLWLLNHPWVGKHLRDWRTHRSLSRGRKLMIILTMWTAITLSVTLGVDALWLKLVIMAVGLLGAYWVWFRIKDR